MSLQLRQLEIGDETEFLAARAAMEHFGFYFEEDMAFAKYLAVLDQAIRGEGLPEGHVASTLLVGVVAGAIVGRLSLRHSLNDALLTVGGHIGYGVLPAHRRRGYGTEMLRQSLPLARDLGLTRVLVTCDEDNIASRKIIETCGGVYENSYTRDLEVPKRRYWIDLVHGGAENSIRS